MIILSQMSYWNFVFHDSAVGSHAALRIGRTATVPEFGTFEAAAVALSASHTYFMR
jgi:hypothetical protein